MGGQRGLVLESAGHQGGAGERQAALLQRQTAPAADLGLAPGLAGVLSLQQLAGNAAVGALLAGRAPLAVQRCGPLHPDCGCPEPEAAPPVARWRGAEPVTSVTVSRQTDPPSGFQDGTPDAPVADLPPGSQYEALDPDVRAMLGRTLLAKSYWRWANDKPTNLGAALDHMGVEHIDTLVQLKNRMFPKGLWSKVQTMTDLWTTSSLGITYNGPSMEAELDAAGSGFCKDTTIGEAYHSGECWREVVEANTPGLHFCTPNSIHIDPHQTSTGTQGGIQFGGGSWVKLRDNYCSYSMVAFISHMMDVEGGRTVNIFDRYARIRDRIARLKAKAQGLQATAPEAGDQVPKLDDMETRRLALDPILRGWAMRGFEGGDAGAQVKDVDQKMDALETELDQVDQTLTDITARHTKPDDYPVLME